MSTVRIFELAREYGIESRELIDRISTIGIQAHDHLTPLDKEAVQRIRDLFDKASFKGVVEKKVTRTVRRRRARRVAPDAAAAAPPAAAAPEVAAPPTVMEAAPAALVAPAVAVVQEPVSQPVTPVVSAPAAPAAPVAAEPPAAPEPAAVAAPVEAPSEPVVVELPAPTPEPVVHAPPAAASAPTPAPAEAATGPAPRRAGVSLPKQPSQPTMERAVVVTPIVDRRVAEAVARTRAEKGYDTAPRGVDPTSPSQERRPGAPPATPDEKRRQEQQKKRGPGRRLVYDKRRDHLRRRGLLEHDDIFRGGRGKKKRPKSKRSAVANIQAPMKEAKRVVKMGAAITVGELAQSMMVKATQVIGKLMGLGVMATVNQAIDHDTAVMIADDFGWRVESVAFDLSNYIDSTEEEVDAESRPPVVTVMGHVDHGKTSLLDCIRKARVADGEAGGITQHIGAYTVDLEEKGRVVFIDTPGHEAFTAMRARGSKATDIVILVVAADDGVMPQTIESINHARAAGVPIVVAVNKIDKSNANPDRVLTELSEHGLVAEAWGGETVVCNVSALKNEGIDQLLEMVLLQAELMELTAPSAVPASGIVLEARLERGRGPVATLLLQEGELSVGDTIVSGTVSGRVRAMTDDKGKPTKKAGPATPIEVIGLSGVPEASDPFHQVKDDKAAAKIVQHRNEEVRKAAQVKQPRVSLDSLQAMLAAGQVKELNVIVKADVHGSAEALSDSLRKLSHPEVEVKVIHSGVGGINESDVNLASASKGIIIGFSVRPEAKAKQLAEQENVELKLYNIIYDALDDVKLAMAGMLSPVEQEKVLGHAEVRMTFTVPKFGTIAGSFVTDGAMNRGGRVRLVRDNKTIYTGTIQSLRRFKNDVREVKQGFECGIGIGYNDLKEGDVIEVFEIEQVAATLE